MKRLLSFGALMLCAVVAFAQTATFTPTNTRTPTKTPTPTNTPWPTWTPRNTFTPSNTATPTRTFTPTRTPPNTRTPRPTLTLTPTRTPTPQIPRNSVQVSTSIIAQGTIGAGRFVGYDNLAGSVAGQPVKGVAVRAMTQGQRGPLSVAGPAEVVGAANTAFNPGDPVASDENGAAIVGGSGDFVAGFATEARSDSSTAPVKILLSIGAQTRVTWTPSPTPTLTPTNTPTPTRTPTP